LDENTEKDSTGITIAMEGLEMPKKGAFPKSKIASRKSI
jgi:hypothetical protein